MDCVSKKSKLCAGVGHPLWNGKCSNCMDEETRPDLIRKNSERRMEQEAEQRNLLELAEQSRHPN